MKNTKHVRNIEKIISRGFKTKKCINREQVGKLQKHSSINGNFILYRQKQSLNMF